METAYEAIYIVETGLATEQVDAIVSKYSDVVTRTGGTIDDIDHLGPRRLAYEVKGRREGYYVVMNFRSEPSSKDELDRIYRISDDVFRHLIIKQDKRADRFPSLARAAENERREREMAARTPIAPVAEPVTDLAAQPAATAAPEDEVVDVADATEATTDAEAPIADEATVTTNDSDEEATESGATPA